MSRRRNFSDWPYWRLHLESVVRADPCPSGRDCTPVAFAEWRARTRARIDAMLGPRPEPVPLDVETTEVVDCGPYRRERVVFDTEHGMAVPAYMLVPHERSARGPAVLAIHGHGPGKDLVCGIAPGGAGDAYADQLACMGYLVLAPDLRGFGERADADPDGRYHCDWNLVCSTMAGVVPLQRNLWDLGCAVELLAAHPLVEPSRIAAVGFSFGATCAVFLTALDARVAAAVVSGYLSSWRAAHEVPGNMCGSQVLPAMLGALEHVDVAALVAPRPMLVESGTDDLIFPVDAARDTVVGLRDVYTALGASPASLVHDVFDGDHRWHGREVGAFLGAALGPVGK